MKNKKPIIFNKKTLFKSKLFNIQSMDLKFSNGQMREYERLQATGSGAVLIVPMLDDKTFLLIREYSCGTDRYEIAFPKGKIENNESYEDATIRELQEEVGFYPHKIIKLKNMSIAPGYLSHITTIVLAQDLTRSKLTGDEPEPLDVMPCTATDIKKLLKKDEFSEARSIAAFYLAQEFLKR
ncbi:MAG: ADP compounds hydrolase NudE [Gammaproteobacteria bacterium]|nr:MAG: ADP compounds hydrolase NudE [Gammaproteobacteria bacterium]